MTDAPAASPWAGAGRKVEVVEVAPRDGIQSFGRPVDTGTKIRMVDILSEAGFGTIEVTGFVHPRFIPNLADAEAVMAGIERRPGTVYRGLAPNARGAERAVAAAVDEVIGLVTASQAYTRKNQNMSVDEAMDEALRTLQIVRQADLHFVLAIGMAIWCPYEGEIARDRVLSLVERAAGEGARRIYFAGSMGMEHPEEVHSLFSAARGRWPDIAFGFHVHNMSGMAIANILAAIDAGASWIEGAICGLGGGVATPVPVGNFPSEDVVRLLNDLGFETGVATEDAVRAARLIAELLEVEPMGHVSRFGTRAEERKHEDV